MSITEKIGGAERKTSARYLSTIFANSDGITWHHSAGKEMTPNTERKRDWGNAKVELQWIRTDPSYTHQINRQRQANEPICMLCNKQMQQSSATHQLGSILPLSNVCAVQGVLHPDLLWYQACGTLAQRNRNALYSSPEIEEKSSGIRHCLAQNKPAFYYYMDMITRSPILQ